MRETILIACFCVVMTVNVIALIRHFMMMRVLKIILENFTETQRQFNELVEDERRKTSLAPE